MLPIVENKESSSKRLSNSRHPQEAQVQKLLQNASKRRTSNKRRRSATKPHQSLDNENIEEIEP